LSLIVGKTITAGAIILVLIVIISIGFIQDYKADEAIKALKKMLVPVSLAIRNGKETEIYSKEIVPEDILIIRSGEMIPADAVILEEKNLQIDESMLTGESKAVIKEVFNEKESDKNTVFMGTFVVNGRAVIKVIHTGMNTNFGKIAGMISSADKPMLLQKKVNIVVKYMVGIALIVSFLTGLLLITRNWPLSYEHLIEALITMIALSISAFPEGLPVVLITTLAIGVQKMAKKNAIVNRLSIIETLGETTVICSDKTGTITKGEMTVKKIYCNNSLIEVEGVGFEGKGNFLLNKKQINPLETNCLKKFFYSAVLCNDAVISRKGIDSQYSTIGSPTESALLIMAAKAGLFKEDFNEERIEEIPFSSESKMMGVSIKDGKKINYFKGAPEIILSNCSHILINEEKKVLTSNELNKLLEKNSEFAGNGLRTIALAFNENDSLNEAFNERKLIFLGLSAIEDPPRKEVINAIKLCTQAGIKTKMITGDNLETAIAIGKQIGLTGKTMLGNELDKITDDELMRTVNEIIIFARVKPAHKLRIVNALKKAGEIVVMTGDGVNDAPSLKEAHVGVAMGIKGTDVSREASDLILKDDNFNTIVSAVSEGRTIYSNVKKFVVFQLSTNFAELMIIFFGLLLGFPLPLLAIQILFLNLVTDNLPAITLGFTPASKDVMNQKPRKESVLLDSNGKKFLILSGATIASGTLFAFWIALDMLSLPLEQARTIALITLISFEIANAFNYRSFNKRFFENKLTSNKYLFYASAVSILATTIVVYTPVNILFETVPINPLFGVMAVIISLSVIIVIDLFKTFNKITNKIIID
ncbi:MAG: cation-transporting P-type ATPase, partial [Candidatus Diapherotrites archaeon]|nr:cation-transporting P-type ATPase [Candidatus Diapherotrites archaeon]